ncbi:MAG: Gfo/Idh/MocA family oxidoreductase [Chloroflexi bacterium]|nr:Gfo/Idh/MocA family oxidoreductase [Chloroflexota bacterium]
MQKVAIVGCGYWGMNYVRVFGELPNASIGWICDKDSGRLDIAGRRAPNAARTRDLHDVVADPEVSAVVVATSSATHFEISLEVLRSGKNLLVEKPLTLVSEEARELVEIAERSRLTLMVGHTFLFNAGVQKVKSLLSNDEFGEIYYMHATRTHLGLIRKDVNAIWDLAPHDISIFNYLVGKEPVWVSAVGSRLLQNNREDVGFATIAYPGGILGNIHVSWIDSNKVREVVVVGSKKRIVFNDIDALEKVRIFEKGVTISGEVDSFGEFQLQLRDGDIISPKIEASEPLKVQCQHFLDCVESGATPISDGKNGLAVVRTMVAIEKSLRQHGAPVEL